MWDLPWTDSDVLVNRRVVEELLKRSYGEPKIEFTIPINWVDEFDIFTNLRYQDPFGVHPTGLGEYGRYYYVESLTYDFLRGTITVSAVDLQFILRQCMILSDCSDFPPANFDWPSASQEERMFAYIGDCGTESFSDGEPLKKLCPCI